MKNIVRNTAQLYDCDKRDNLLVDVPFYVEYAKKQAGEVLELGCGTGRVAIELAKRGFKVTGIDLSSSMLDVFSKKIQKTNFANKNIKIVHGDMSSFNLQKKFKLIIAPFRSFQALTINEKAKSCLSCIYNHLDEHGIFIINVFNPKGDMSKWDDTERIQWKCFDSKTQSNITKKNKCEKVDAKQQIIYSKYSYEVIMSDGTKRIFTDTLEFKYYYYEQLKDMLINSKFEIVEEYSWYDKTPIGGREIIFICKKTS